MSFEIKLCSASRRALTQSYLIALLHAGLLRRAIMNNKQLGPSHTYFSVCLGSEGFQNVALE